MSRLVPRFYRYLISEMALPFLLALGIISFLLLTKQLLNLVDLVLQNGVSPFVVLRLVAYIVPATFAVTVPMSLLVAVLLALGRLAADLELTALRAGGVGLGRLYPPLVALGLAASLGMLAFNETALPRFNEAYKLLFYQVLSQRSDVALRSGVWVKDFENMLVYVDSKDPATRELEGVTIVRPGAPGQATQWIRARQGRLSGDPSGYRLNLDLYDGSMQTVSGPKAENLTTIFFDYSRFDLDLGGAMGHLRDGDRQPSEMTIREIRRQARAMPPEDPRRAHWLTEMHKKIAIPFACLFFLMCGLPLGTLTRRGGRTLGFVFAIALIFVYYVLLSLGQTYGDGGRLPAWLAMWLPNLAMGLIALWAGIGAFTQRGLFAFGRGG